MPGYRFALHTFHLRSEPIVSNTAPILLLEEAQAEMPRCDSFFHGPFLFLVAFLSLGVQLSLEKGANPQGDLTFSIGVLAFRW